MSRQELTCQHGIGHSADIHGCDGCCSIIADAVEKRIIKLLEETKLLTTIEQGVLVNYAEDAIALIKGENK